MKIIKVHFSKAVTIITIFISLLVLIGWIFNIPVLKSILPQWPVMRFNGAIGLLLSGITLYLFNKPSLSLTEKRIAQLLAFIILLIGLFTLSQFFFGYDAGIDELFWKDDTAAVTYPGRITPFAAFNFILIGFVFLILPHKKFHLIVQIALLLMIPGLIQVFLDYSFGTSLLQFIPQSINMAFHGAVLFVLIAIGIILSPPLSYLTFSFQKKIISFFALVIWMIILIFSVIKENQQQLIDSSELVDSVRAVIIQSEKMAGDVVDLESGSRGFVITGDEKFIESYTMAVKSLNAQLKDLSVLTIDDPRQQLKIDSLEIWIKERTDFLVLQIEVRKAGRFDAAKTLIQTEQGKFYTNKIKRMINDLQQDENDLLEKRKAVNQQNIENYKRAVIVFQIILGMALVIIILIIRKNTRARNKAEEEIKSLNATLETRIEEKTKELSLANKELVFQNEEIEKSEKKFRELFEKSGDAILIIKNGVFTECNQATLDVLGYKKQEDILNLQPSELSPEFQPDGLRSSEKQKELINIALEKGTHHFEWIHTKSNGEIFPVEVLLTTIENEPNNAVIHCVWRDITDRKKVEMQLQKQNEEYATLNEEYIFQNQALKQLSNELSENNTLLVESKDRFKNLFEKNPVSLWEEDFSAVKEMLTKKKEEVGDLKTYLDDHHYFVKKCASKIEILRVNEITLKLFGVKDIKELKIHLQKTDNVSSFEVLKKELIAIASNENEFIEESEFISKNGNVIKAIIKSSMLEGSNKAIVSIIDITELKNYEEKLIEAKEKAEESGRLKTKFIQNMSHEIRTPMNGILGFTELLDNPTLSEEKRKHFIEIIKNSTNQLLHIIDDIMEISVLETKQIKAVENPVCLNDLLNELFTVFNLKATKNKTSLVLTNGLSDPESIILTDKNKLNKVLGNLLENALKFTNKGCVEFGYQLKNKELEIFVKDSGIGIKLEAQKLIFERFSQAEKDLSKIVSGLGLGLSIAKENAELLGGKISVISKLGEGATFFVTIPYKPVSVFPKITIEKVKIPEKKEKYTILIVEDEEVNFMFLEILLTDKIKLPCHIIHAKDGLEAVAFCKNNPAVELVLMDIKMPNMDGHEATRLIKEFRPNLPIVAQTAYSTAEERAKAISAGCDDFISKPISKETLSAIINNYLLASKHNDYEINI